MTGVSRDRPSGGFFGYTGEALAYGRCASARATRHRVNHGATRRRDLRRCREARGPRGSGSPAARSERSIRREHRDALVTAVVREGRVAACRAEPGENAELARAVAFPAGRANRRTFSTEDQHLVVAGVCHHDSVTDPGGAGGAEQAVRAACTPAVGVSPDRSVSASAYRGRWPGHPGRRRLPRRRSRGRRRVPIWARRSPPTPQEVVMRRLAMLLGLTLVVIACEGPTGPPGPAGPPGVIPGCIVDRIIG